MTDLHRQKQVDQEATAVFQVPVTFPEISGWQAGFFRQIASLVLTRKLPIDWFKTPFLERLTL